MIRPQEFASEFPGCPESVRLARRMVARVLVGCPAADAAVLAVSELAANSVRWSRSGQAGGTYLVEVVVTPATSAAVFVADGGCADADELEGDGLDGGRGLQVVASIAEAWGIACRNRDAWTGTPAGERRASRRLAAVRGGTCTWFRVSWAATPGMLPQAQPGGGGGTWCEVMQRAAWRCECGGARGSSQRCLAEHATGRPLRLAPLWPASERVIAGLPAAALVALCADCDVTLTGGAAANAEQQAGISGEMAG